MSDNMFLSKIPANLKEVIKPLFDISSNMLDTTSQVEITGEKTLIKLRAINNQCCPIDIDIISKSPTTHDVDIYIDCIGPMIEENIDSIEYLRYFQQFLYTILKNEIIATDVFYNGKIKRTKITYYEFWDKVQKRDYTSGLYSLFNLFRSKKTMERRYEPWLKTNN